MGLFVSCLFFFFFSQITHQCQIYGLFLESKQLRIKGFGATSGTNVFDKQRSSPKSGLDDAGSVAILLVM